MLNNRIFYVKIINPEFGSFQLSMYIIMNMNMNMDMHMNVNKNMNVT